MDDTSESMLSSSSEAYAGILLVILAAGLGVVTFQSILIRLSVVYRLRAARGNRTSSKTSTWYTLVSVCREISYGQLCAPIIGRLPNNGVLCVCTSYLIVLLCCLLTNLHLTTPILWETVAMRAAYLSLAQLVMLIVLSAKTNVLGYCLGSSSERLLVYHRLLGYCTLLTLTIHMAFFMREWLYYDVWDSQWEEMGASMLRWGYAAWGILCLTVMTSVSFFRHHLYSYWIIMHILCMITFFIMATLHVDAPYRPWTIAPPLIWAVDHLWRIVKRARINTDFSLQPSLKHNAGLRLLPGQVTRITIDNCAMKKSAGQYVYLSIHNLGMHSHPVTVVSAHDTDTLIMLMKAKKGFTNRILSFAASELLPSKLLRCSIEGPYGGAHTPMQAFDTVLLIAGGVGASFTTSLLQDLVKKPGCCRAIHFIWSVKEWSHVCWYSNFLVQCLSTAQMNNVVLRIEIFITSQDVRSGLCSSGCRSVEITSETLIGPSLPACMNHDIEKSTPSLTCDDSNLRSDNSSCRTKEAPLETGITYTYGRPNFSQLIMATVQQAIGESGIAFCGPSRMATSIRNHVVDISDTRAIKKGSGAEAIYLHIEEQT